MSDVIKAQTTHQSVWYTCRTSLDANGMPDKSIEVDLQQLHQIKISFEEGSKDIKISHESYNPNLLDCRHESLLKCHMLSTQHDHLDYQTRCTWLGMIWAQVLHRVHGRWSTTVQPYWAVFPGRWLTKCNKVVRKQCPNDNDFAKECFEKLTLDYQRQAPGCPT